MAAESGIFRVPLPEPGEDLNDWVRPIVRRLYPKFERFVWPANKAVEPGAGLVALGEKYPNELNQDATVIEVDCGLFTQIMICAIINVTGFHPCKVTDMPHVWGMTSIANMVLAPRCTVGVFQSMERIEKDLFDHDACVKYHHASVLQWVLRLSLDDRCWLGMTSHGLMYCTLEVFRDMMLADLKKDMILDCPGAASYQTMKALWWLSALHEPYEPRHDWRDFLIKAAAVIPGPKSDAASWVVQTSPLTSLPRPLRE